MTHPSVEEVAEHLEGLLPPETEDRVRAHLAQCADCATIARDVAATTGVLRSAAETVPPMPEHLAGRVDAAIAEESRRRTGAAEPAGAPPAPPPAAAGVSPLADRRARRRRRVGGALLAAAAVTVVAVGVSDIWQGGQSSDSAEGRSVPAQGTRALEGAGGGPGGTADSAPPRLGDRAPAERPLRSEAQSEGQSETEQGAGAPDQALLSTRSALIEGAAAAHNPQAPGSDRRGCVAGALGGARAAGASYSVDLASGPGVVLLRPSARPTRGVLLACGPVPRVLLRQPLPE